MPPIPTSGAPTQGVIGLIYWGLLALAIFVAVIRYYMPSGKQRLDYQQQKETSAIQVLQEQIDRLQEEVQGLRRDVRKMAKNEEYNREYRHVLANQVNALLFAADSSRQLLNEVHEEWPEMPHHLVKRIEGVRAPKDILTNYPMPEPRPDDESA